MFGAPVGEQIQGLSMQIKDNGVLHWKHTVSEDKMKIFHELCLEIGNKDYSIGKLIEYFKTSCNYSAGLLKEYKYVKGSSFYSLLPPNASFHIGSRELTLKELFIRFMESYN